MDKYLKHVNGVLSMIEDTHRNVPPTPVKVGCELIFEALPALTRTERASGWGEDAVSVTMVGMPMKFTVVRDGKPAFSVRISDDGSLKITNYQGHYQPSIVNNLDLEPTVPWK